MDGNRSIAARAKKKHVVPHSTPFAHRRISCRVLSPVPLFCMNDNISTYSSNDDGVNYLLRRDERKSREC